MSLPPYKNKGVKRAALANFDAYQVAGVDITAGLAGLAVSGATTAFTGGITASATQTLAGATKLTAKLNQVSTSAAAGNAVSLPALLAGQSVTIFNDGANAIKVFPAAAGVAIDGGSAGAAVTLSAGKRALFLCTAANVIESAQLGAAAA